MILDKFIKYEKHPAKKNKIIGNLQSEVTTVSSKVSKLGKQAAQQEQYSRRNYVLVHEIKEARGETTDDITIKTMSQNLDNYIAPHNIEKNHRTGQ